MVVLGSEISAWLTVAIYMVIKGVLVAGQMSKGSVLQAVYQFGNESWIENIAIRANGNILATDLVKGLVYDLDPNNKSVVPVVVARFPQGSTPTGATEVEPDVFYIGNTLGNAFALTFKPGTSSIWKIDMNSYTKGGKATFSKVVDIPPAQMLNGIATVSSQTGIILVTDSIGGTIYSVNVRRPSYKLALDHHFLKPDPAARPSFGVNGVRVRGSRLYFCNTNYGYLGTFPISHDGKITPVATLITSSVPAADDFDIDDKGNVWLAENEQNTLVRVSPFGKVDIIAGGENSTELLGPVSARFGRCANKKTLYVSTDGLSFDAKGNPLTTAGKIAKIDVEHGTWGLWP